MLTRSEPCSITFDSLHRPSRAYLPPAMHGGSCLVFDAVIDATGSGLRPDRPWGPGNNPKTAVHAFLASHPEFAIDAAIPNKLLITVAPDGYLKRIR